MRYFIDIILSILLIVFLNYSAQPIYHILKRKIISRFFEGRITDNELWHKQVLKTCTKWIINTPTVSSTDNYQTLLQIISKKNRKSSIQVWQSASLYIALSESREIKDRSVLNEFSEKVANQYNLKNISDSDFGMLAFAVFDNPSFSDFKKSMLNYVSNNMTDDIIVYKSHAKKTAFIDTLGFVCPFLVKYGIDTKNDEYINLAKKQFELYYKYGIEENSNLPFHAFDIENHTKLGICDWARGLAWLLIGLMDSYKVLIPSGIKDSFFEEEIKKYAGIVLQLQKPYGGYSWRLLSNYETDSSATAVFGWFLACAGNIFGNNEYIAGAKKCREFLRSKTRNNGAIDYCQGDTLGVGNYSRSFDIMPFAEGFALRMHQELEYGREKIEI